MVLSNLDTVQEGPEQDHAVQQQEGVEEQHIQFPDEDLSDADQIIIQILSQIQALTIHSQVQTPVMGLAFRTQIVAAQLPALTSALFVVIWIFQMTLSKLQVLHLTAPQSLCISDPSGCKRVIYT